MKKIIATLLLVAGVCGYSHAQGTVAVYNIGNANGNYTNSGTASQPGVSGLTSTAANGFYYALLIAPASGAEPTLGATDSGWSVGMMATNYLSPGGIRGAGGSTGSAIAGWAGSTTDYVMLVGWSANLGTTWSQVEAQLASGNWSGIGFYGASAIETVTSATSPSPATSIFGGTGLPGGITLYSTVTPEPGTMALAGLGIASLLALRRKK